jgi:tryptophan synthase beta chain
MFEKIQNRPDARGRYGDFGGMFVPEVLMPALMELVEAYEKARTDPTFEHAYRGLLKDVVGRPSPLYYAERLSKHLGAHVYLKREDLNHTGAHKINNTLGQALLCERMGKKRVIAETGAGQHGVATATACALFGFECVVYMGAEDVRRQSLNVERMRLLGAQVVAVETGTRTLKDAMNEALRDWVTHVDTTYYLVGTAGGPHPYPWLVRDLQSVIGEEARAQCLAFTGKLPDAVLACVGGGSNAIGLFHAFVPDTDVALMGVEAAGQGLHTGVHSASLVCGTPAVLHGAWTLVLQEKGGQIAPAHSLAPGLDYPGVGPEHCYLQSVGRAQYQAVQDHEAVEALQLLARTEGILCALESAHAVAATVKWAREHPGQTCVVGLSGRGDKDMPELTAYLARRSS